MRRPLTRTRALWLLTFVSYAVALWQRPGKTVSDTRLELSLDPSLFLSRVTHLWSGTTDLGHVQSGQFNGYLFPMGPWFAGGDALGLPMWLVQRLWLGTLLALAAWGVVRLLDELLEPSARRPVAQLATGLLFVFNPYVVQFTSRGTVAFIAYAALPWLMVAAHRGARAPRGWRWPAAVALVLAASGGGVNAALIAFMLLGPVGLLAYDAWTGALRWRAIGSFAWRAGLLGALASAWWAIPVLLQSGYGADFLSFTEQPGTIWATTSMSEGVRELGFWGMYVGSGFGHQLPFISTAHYYLFNPAVLVGSFSVPVLAVAGLRLARSWRYAPFFGLLAVVSLVVMAAGYPQGTPMRHALDFLYGNVPAGRFLRTTYKAAPVLILAFACLGGAATAAIVERLRAASRGPVAGARALGARPSLLSFRPARAAAFAALLLPLLAGAPLLLGTAIDSHQEYSVPTAWPRALDDATAAAGPDGRTAIVPGEIFGMYRWGATMDPVGPGLERRPVAIREVVPYADQRSAQLQTAVDDLVQQDRLAPGQLGPLLKLMGVRQLVVPTDSRRRRSGALDPVGAAVALAREPELRRSTQHYGDVHLFKPKFGRSGPRLELSELRRYALPPGPGMVRVQPDAGATVLDGDAAGVTALAGVGALDPSRSLFYSPDVAAPVLRRLVAGGARLVLTDSNRRRAYVASRTRLNTGPTLTETAPIKSDFSRYTPFGDRPTAATTAAYSTLSRLYAPALPAFNQFPERSAYAVFDGRRDTTWLADPVLDPPKRYVQATLRRPLRAPWVEVFPHVDRLGGTTRVELTFNGGHRREVAVSPAGTRVAVPVPELRTLRVRIAKTHHTGRKPVAGGLDEVRIPGLRVNEWLRLPTDLSAAARGLSLARNELDVVLERTTADFPRRTGRRTGAVQDVNPLDAVDPEPSIQRQVDLPAARAFRVSGWASVSPTAPDDAIDRLAGVPAAWRMTSSSRFEGVPGRRASSAFDSDPRTAWIGDLSRPWIAWRSPRALTVRRLLIGSGPSDYRRPAVVRVSAGGASRTAPVGKSGRVALGAPLRGRSFRVDVVATSHSARLPGVAIGELRVPGLRAPAPRRRGSFRTRCGALGMRAVGTRTAPLAVSGSLRALDDGDSLRLASCGGPLRLPAGSTLIGSPPGAALRADRVLLRSPAPAPPAGAAAPAGRVLSVSGEGPLGVPDRARISVQRPAWLVLGQSWSRGWRASCRDASGKSSDLGEPLPIDGFANGWRIEPGCVDATFSFPPQRFAVAGYALSALAFLVCLVIALVGWRHSRRRRPAAVSAVAAGAEPAPRLPDAPADPGAPAPRLPEPALRLDWRRALALAVAVGIAGGFVFAIRAGVVLAPLTFLAAWRGIDARRLTVLALAAIGLLPLIYLVFQPKNRGGFAFSYANDLLGAHWVAAFAIACIAAASLLTARAWRAAGASALDGADHAVPGGDLAQQRDPHEEGEPRPVARLHADDA